MKYVRCDSHCKYPAYTQEEMNALIEEVKKYAKEYAEELAKPEIITALCVEGHTIQEEYTYESVNLTETSKEAENLSVSEGKILIGSGIDKVTVEYKGQIIPAADSQKYISLYKNEERLFVNHVYGTKSQRTEVTQTRAIIDVSEGDLLELKCHGLPGDVFEQERLYITVEKVC